MKADVAIAAMARGAMRTSGQPSSALGARQQIPVAAQHGLQALSAYKHLDALRARPHTAEELEEARDSVFYELTCLALAGLNALAAFPDLEQINYDPMGEGDMN